MLSIQREIRKFENPKKAKDVSRFFKTAPGQYGHGDFFLGLTVPKTRAIAGQFLHLNFSELKILLESIYHEERLAALVILNKKFELTEDIKAKKQIVNFYLKNTSRINNWDLVDVTAYKIIGRYCLLLGDDRIIRKLAGSKHHWEKRISMVSTLAFTKAKQLDLVYELAEVHKSASEDLMHKALGWMLREAGKIDDSRLKSYLLKKGKTLPRISVRYAIERFTEGERKKLLKVTKPESGF